MKNLISLIMGLSFLIQSYGTAETISEEEQKQLNDQLIKASRKGETETIKELLDSGADVNAKTDFGSTALIRASDWGQTKAVKALLDSEADVNVKTIWIIRL